MKRLLPAILTVALCLIPAWNAGAADPPLDIDVILSQSGILTFVGQTDAKVLATLEDVVNKQGGIRGRPIHFVLHDDHTDPQVAIQLTNEIIAKHPAIILGSSSASSCSAEVPIVGTSGPVTYCLSPAVHPANGSYMFSSSFSSSDAMVAAIRYFRALGLKRLAALSTTDVSGQDGDANLDAALALPENKNAGVNVVTHEHFATSDLSVAAQMSRIKASNPQALVLWASGTPLATGLRAMQDAGVDVPVVVPNANMSYTQLQQYASFVPKNLLFAGVPYLAGLAPTKGASDAQKQFFDAFTAAGVRPDFLYSTSWDPAVIAIAALRAIGPNATAAQLKNYIEGLHGFNAVAGEYDFRDGGQRGLTVRNVVIMRWDPAKVGWVAVSQLGGLPLH